MRNAIGVVVNHRHPSTSKLALTVTQRKKNHEAHVQEEPCGDEESQVNRTDERAQQRFVA